MINNLNLSLKINNTEVDSNRPFTPIEATLRTPLDPPPFPQCQVSSQPMQPSNSSSFFFNNNWIEQPSVYQNPQYNESDDILTDIDEPSGFSRKNYTIYFTPQFDQLLMSIYSNILSLPTTTPFSGSIPPSGLVGKVANETMINLLKLTNESNCPLFDQQCIINREYLKNQEYQPIILQLIRKRLLDLCHFGNNPGKLPEATTTYGASNIVSLRQSSISNLSLSEMNISNFHPNNSSNTTGNVRSRSSSLNLRKQSLTRNNSNNWLHVGNMSNLRSSLAQPPGVTYSNFNISTDSLQSIQDSVPQAMLTRTSSNSGQFQQPNPQYAMMMEYHQNNTPPTNKTSLYTPPPSASNLTSNFNIPTINDQEEFEFLSRNRRTNQLNIDTNLANLQLQPPTIPTSNTFNSYRRNSSGNSALDSPFMSESIPHEEFYNGFNQQQNGTVNVNGNVNVNSNSNSPLRDDSPELFKDGRFNLHNSINLNEKKRDSLKLKRGIH